MSAQDPLAALMRQGAQPQAAQQAAQQAATRAKPFAPPDRTLEADARNRAKNHSDERLGACWIVATRARRNARKADDTVRAAYWHTFLVALAEEAAKRRVPERRSEWGDELFEAREAVRAGRPPLEGS